MSALKERIQQVLAALPDSATLEEFKHELHVREALEEGLRAIEEGRIISHEEVERQMDEWLKE